jgi:hypothetical protein
MSSARSDSIPAGFACLKMIATAFAQLEKARLAKKPKVARDRIRRSGAVRARLELVRRSWIAVCWR